MNSCPRCAELEKQLQLPGCSVACKAALKLKAYEDALQHVDFYLDEFSEGSGDLLKVAGSVDRAMTVLRVELAGLHAALRIAQKRGEHSPLCNAPPYEATLTQESWELWWSENEGKCTCWKNEMEKAIERAEAEATSSAGSTAP